MIKHKPSKSVMLMFWEKTDTQSGLLILSTHYMCNCPSKKMMFSVLKNMAEHGEK
jgi:hypothetical protein